MNIIKYNKQISYARGTLCCIKISKHVFTLIFTVYSFKTSRACTVVPIIIAYACAMIHTRSWITGIYN
jgi:hypothetical protein